MILPRLRVGPLCLVVRFVFSNFINYQSNFYQFFTQSIKPSAREQSALTSDLLLREPSEREPSVLPKVGSEVVSPKPSSAAAPSVSPRAADATAPESTAPNTIIFRPTIIVVQNVFTIPPALLAQLQAAGGAGALQSLVTVQNQEVFIFPSSVQVSSLAAAYPASAGSPSQPFLHIQGAGSAEGASKSSSTKASTAGASSAPSGSKKK